MRSKAIKEIPCPTLRRLPDYYNIFSSALVQEQEYISSIEISNFLGIDHTQVRKDMAFIGFSGKPKVGFEVRSFVSYFNKSFFGEVIKKGHHLFFRKDLRKIFFNFWDGNKFHGILIRFAIVNQI